VEANSTGGQGSWRAVAPSDDDDDDDGGGGGGGGDGDDDTQRLEIDFKCRSFVYVPAMLQTWRRRQLLTKILANLTQLKRHRDHMLFPDPV
jgi:hypothetical protein